MSGSKVYFVQDARGFVKIGFSTDPLSRIMSLQTAHASRLVILRIIDGGPITERWLHKRYAPLRASGEWFDFHPAMLTVIPPDEIPAAPRVLVVRRDVRLSLREKVRQAVTQAESVGVGRKSAILLLASELTEDQADHAIDLLLSGPVSSGECE